MEEEYQKIYRVFVDALHESDSASYEAGETIALLTEQYIQHNLQMVKALKAYALVTEKISQQTDSSGKAISSAKAEQLAAATDEAAAYELARVHVQNIEKSIEALKAIQTGLAK